jgi:membrane-associated phospholipid phosphatase
MIKASAKDINISIQLKGIDWITLAYCIWMLLLITFGWNSVQHPLKHFLSYISIITALFMLIWTTEYLKLYNSQEYCSNGICRIMRPKAYKPMQFIRQYYPILLYLYFFESVSATNRVMFQDWLDPFFMQIDKAIFGYLPSNDWAIMFGNSLLSEMLHFAYFCYYPMIFGLPIYFYLKRRKAVDELVFVLSFVFYFCYFIFSWLPVIGGRYFPAAMAHTQAIDGGLFTRIMAVIYIKSPHLGGAFPSSHVAVAVVLSLMALKYNKWLGYVLLMITFFLSIATVYCHYHWFIDAVCGVITGLAGFGVGQIIYKKLPENRNG